jgi:hypothetical protein
LAPQRLSEAILNPPEHESLGPNADESPPNGTVRQLDGKTCVYYDGYWIRRYEVPPDAARARCWLARSLIVALTFLR